MKKYDAIIIGSGIGGLTAAGILASAGLKTLLLERHSSPGGYMSSFRRSDFIFDSVLDTISGMARGAILYRVLERLGVHNSVDMLDVDPIRVSMFPDFDINVDAHLDRYIERLSAKFLAEKSSIDNFFCAISKAYSEFQIALSHHIAGNFPLGVISADTLKLMSISYGQLLDSFFSDRVLKAVLSDRCPFIGLGPHDVSAAAMINMIMSYFFQGAQRPAGGFQKLADTFIDGIRGAAGEVKLGHPADQIILDNKGLCSGVICDNGEAFYGTYVISNADYSHTFNDLIGGSYSGFPDNTVRDPGISKSFFLLYAGIKGNIAEHSSIGYYPSYNMQSYFDPQMSFREDSTIGVSIASLEDKLRAPEGYCTAVFHEMVEAPVQRKKMCTELVLNKAERIFPGIRDKIVMLEAASPDTLQRYTYNIRGASFGWKQRPGFRGPKHHGIPNLYCAGHWADLGGGVLAAASSGAKAACAILLKEGIKDVI